MMLKEGSLDLGWPIDVLSRDHGHARGSCCSDN